MPLAAALLLAALLAIPASNIAQAQAPPGNELTLVNADREFVERKGGGEFVARPKRSELRGSEQPAAFQEGIESQVPKRDAKVILGAL